MSAPLVAHPVSARLAVLRVTGPGSLTLLSWGVLLRGFNAMFVSRDVFGDALFSAR